MRRPEIKTFLSILLLLLSTGVLSAEEKESTAVKTDRREEILRYGIDTEVLSLLGELQQEKIGKYNELLTSVIQETRDVAIRQGIYRLWDDTSYSPGLDLARKELDKVLEDEDFDTAVVQTAISYIANQGDVSSLDQLGQLVSYRDTKISAASVRAVGKIAAAGGIEREDLGQTLLTRLKSEDPVAEEDLYSALIVSLGSLEYPAAADELVQIVEDGGASAGHRRLACVSVGEIGRKEDFQVIEQMYFETTDATLRAYALAGLAKFPDVDMTDTLVQALKRDSFWRIRLTAAENLAGVEDEAVSELLRYKAIYDPVNQVRIASLKALGTTGGEKNQKFILDYFLDTSKGTDLRLAALGILVDNRIPGTNSAVNSIMDKLWTKDEGRFLEFVCRDLSRSEWGELSPLFERMLGHNSWLLQIYGIRGIRRNDIAGLQGKVDALDSEGVDTRVRREVTEGK